MGYYYYYSGKAKFSRSLTEEEIEEFYKKFVMDINIISDGFSICEHTKDRFSSDDFKKMSIDFFKPKDIYFQGEISWKGEEWDDLGYFELDSENDVFNEYVGNITVNYVLQ